MRPSDEDLVARHLRGDPEAFAELVARYTGRLFHLTCRFTGDRTQAEDMTQETLVRAYAALPRSQAERSFRPWLFQIAVNLCRDWARRNKNRALLFSDIGAGPGEEFSPEEVIADDEPSPIEHLEAKELDTALRQAVADLPEQDRLLLTLRYDEGLSYTEIGDWLKVPSATVGTHLFRAKRRLRQALSQFEEAER